MDDFYTISKYLGIALIVVLILLDAMLRIGWPGEARRRELRKFAASHGWEFSSAKHKKYAHCYPHFRFLSRDPKAFARNVMAGEWKGHMAVVFDYTWPGDGGKRTATVVILEPDFPMRPFMMRPEVFAHRVADFFGKGDIDFESIEFSEKFHVTSTDRRWTYDFFHLRTIQYIMEEGISLVICDGRAIVIDPAKKILTARKIKHHLNRIAKLVNLTPVHLRKGET